MTVYCLFLSFPESKVGVKSLVVIYLFTIIHRLRRFQRCLFSAPEIFIPDAYGKKNRRQKIDSIYGAGFWSVRVTMGMLTGWMPHSSIPFS